MNAMDLNLMLSVERVSQLVASSFVTGLWQGIVLAAAVGLCLRLLPKTTAAIRFAIWTAVFAVLAVLPLFHAYTLRKGVSTSAGGAVMHVDVRWSFAIAAVWMIVSLVRGINLAMSATRLRAIWKRAVPVEGCDEILLAAGFRGVEICTSRDVDRPSVIGFFSPRILIPEELFERLTTAEFGQIVLHEVGHLRRADDWINLLQKVSLVIVPLNPVLIWIERRLCLERELACDDDVLRLTKAPKAYATCLTNLAEHRLSRRAAMLTLGAWEKKSELARRVHSILRGGEAMSRAHARVVMGAFVLVLLGGATELARCPQFISFSETASPASVAARTLPVSNRQTATYQPVSFQSAPNTSTAPHETLLKASMPLDRGPQAAPKTTRPHRVAPKPQFLRSSSRRDDAPQMGRTEHWVVLTSWTERERPRAIYAVTEDRVISTSYAAVPTAGGWLIIQL
jgi:BlaR1 peptidase M56